MYLIWSNERGRWWKPNCNGYTNRLDEAGRYVLGEALHICNAAVPGLRADLPSEIPVEESVAKQLEYFSALSELSVF